MKSCFSEKQKKDIVKRYCDGESVSNLSKEINVAKGTIYVWINKYRTFFYNQNLVPTDYYQLKRTVERQSKIIAILKTVECTASSSLTERMCELEKLIGKYDIRVLCDALDVDRGTFYNHIKRNKLENVWYKKRREYLREEIRRVFDENDQILGARKITAVLQNNGEAVSVRLVRELMQEMNLASIRTNSKSEYIKDKRKHNHLRQQFSVDGPNTVWTSDVTYFRYNDKWYYICTVIDLFPRKVIAYGISRSNSTQLTKSTLRKAFETRSYSDNLMFHSDNGSNYISLAFEKYLAAHKVTHSFSRAHNPHDNAVSESFFSSMKREELYRRKFKSEAEMMKAVAEYIEFYNDKRPHATLNYKTPNQFETEYYEKSRNS